MGCGLSSSGVSKEQKRKRKSEKAQTVFALMYFIFSSNWHNIRDSIVASIPACHAGDRGSIPRLGASFAFCVLLEFNECIDNGGTTLEFALSVVVFDLVLTSSTSSILHLKNRRLMRWLFCYSNSFYPFYFAPQQTGRLMRWLFLTCKL